MNGCKPIQERITPKEALRLFKYGKISEMYISKALYDAYREEHGTDNDALWDLMGVLSFVYDTGRVQGIREARARKRG